MITIIETLEAGEPLSDLQQRELAQMLNDFKQTEVYKILKRMNDNEIKCDLTVSPKVDAERLIGRHEGLLGGFENRINACINVVRNEKIKRKVMKNLSEE